VETAEGCEEVSAEGGHSTGFADARRDVNGDIEGRIFTFERHFTGSVGSVFADAGGLVNLVTGGWRRP